MDAVESGELINLRKLGPTQKEIVDRLEVDKRIRVASYNMLFTLYEKQKKHAPIHNWSQRKVRVIKLIDEMSADLIGAQELMSHQLTDLLEAIGDNYKFFGQCRDGEEICPIFYNPKRLLLVEGSVEEIPDPYSWHKAQLTRAEFLDKKTGHFFVHYNTHLSFSNPEARQWQADYIVRRIKKEDDIPVILSGDFNTFPMRLDMPSLPFVDGDQIIRLLTSERLRDSEQVSLLGHIGPLSTFTNKPGSPKPFCGTGDPGVVLDHIFVSPHISVVLHATDPTRIDGHFPSDHMPIITDLLWE